MPVRKTLTLQRSCKAARRSRAPREGVLVLVLVVPVVASAQTVADLAAGKAAFENRCGVCHGADGKGGGYAPNIVTPGLVQSRSADEVRELIRDGIPARGMPPVAVPEPELTQLIAFYRSQIAPAIESPVSGDPARGAALLASHGCISCHSRGPQSKVLGPDLAWLGAERTLGKIRESIVDPNAEVAAGYEVVDLQTNDGERLRAFARNRSNFDLQLQTFDGRFRFVSMDDIASVKTLESSLMPAKALPDHDIDDLVAFLSRQDGSAQLSQQRTDTSAGVPFERILNPTPGEWPTYNGNINGNRHSSLDQINTDNVGQLQLAWMFPTESPNLLETTPVVVDGVMYVTFANTVHALDAYHGREIWSHSQPRTPKILGASARAANRGVAVLGDRVFVVTDHAHLLALDRLTGRKLWDVEMADHRQNYNATAAPLVINNMVISGIAGGDQGVRGFLAAYDAATGERLWRFWTIPLPGEPLSETWVGDALPHGCGTTWLTGTYDPDLDLLYWTTGNPCPDYNGDERLGDNLYTNSILALRPDSGELAWYYQYTPHDEHDWDSIQTPMLVDRDWEGAPRKLLVQANRNGFFYVLDREDGELLLAKPFIDKLTWASGIGEDGRPILIPGKRPTPEGNIVCPGLQGAANWPAVSYNPDTGLFYVMAAEFCHVFTKRNEEWQAGQTYYGGAGKSIPGDPQGRYLRAIDISTGEKKWEIHAGDTGWYYNFSGVASTAGGLVFFGDNAGAFIAARATNGEMLWSRHLNARPRAGAMTYMLDGKQFVAIAAGKNVVAFALP